jgi:hypothetical protein
MKNAEMEKVHNLIELLTLDEDIKQDLWLKYLSGCPIHCLPDALCDLIREELNTTHSNYETCSNNHKLYSFCDHIKHLPYHQQNIILLIYIGFTVESIGEYKGISLVRIKQAVASFYRDKVNNAH